jgi:hypothetical protein
MRDVFRHDLHWHGVGGPVLTGLPLIKRGNQLPWQCTTLRLQTLWTRSVTREGATRESNACKQCAAHARHLEGQANVQLTHRCATARWLHMLRPASFGTTSCLFAQGRQQDQYSFEVREPWRFRFRPFVTTHFSTTVSNFRGWFRWIGMWPHGWPALFFAQTTLLRQATSCHYVTLMSLMLRGTRLWKSLSLYVTPKIHISR